MDAVFGVLLPGGGEERLSPEEQALFDERQQARKAARVRAGRRGARRGSRRSGVVLEDTPQGTRWKRTALSPQALRGPHRGEPGEELACQHLRASGLRILERNYRCRTGEIDIVARDGDTHGVRRGEGAPRRLARRRPSRR